MSYVITSDGTRSQRTATDITSVTVLGTGVLGSQIAYQSAYSGFEVTAYDTKRALSSSTYALTSAMRLSVPSPRSRITRVDP